MKAMILAAGLGTRLLPATEYLPKPCFPILNIPLIVRIVEKLRGVGVSELVINLHHLPDIVEKLLEEYSVLDDTVHLSFEEEILGTAGGIKKVEHILKDDTFILHNGDIYSEADLKDALRFHNEKGSKATMVVTECAEGEGGVPFIGLDDDGRITCFPYGALRSGSYAKRTHFSGIHILDPVVFDYIPADKFYGINDRVYPDMLSDRHGIYGYVSKGYWHDIGNKNDYIKLNSRLLGGRGFLAGEGTTIAEGCEIGPNVVIGKGCVIESGCVISDSIVFDDVIVEGGAIVRDSIVLKGRKIAANSEIKDMIAT